MSLHGTIPRYIKHLRPLGSHVTSKPKSKELKTFGQRVWEGLNLLHDDGGVYRILTETGVV